MRHNRTTLNAMRDVHTRTSERCRRTDRGLYVCCLVCRRELSNGRWAVLLALLDWEGALFDLLQRGKAPDTQEPERRLYTKYSVWPLRFFRSLAFPSLFLLYRSFP